MELLGVFDVLAKTCQLGNATITEEIINIFRTLFMIVKWGVPILLVIWGSWDLGKAVMAQKDDEIKSAQKLFIKKLIIALCVFLVPTFVQITLGVVSKDTSDDCWNCVISDKCKDTNG